jgi:hypothetical protein
MLGSRSDGQEARRGGMLTELGFRLSAAMSQTVGEHRWCSGGFQRWWRGRWRLAQWGELVCMVVVLVCFLQRGWGVAGATAGEVELRSWTLALIGGEIEQTESIRRCARSRGVCRDQKRAASLPNVIGIKRRRQQYWRASVSEFAAARRCFGSGSRGKWRGARGLLIDVDMARYNGQDRWELIIGGNHCARGNGHDFNARRKTVTWLYQVGPTCQRGRKIKEDTASG